MEAAVAVALADYAITERCLRQLGRWARDRGLQWVVDQVHDDPGLTFMPTADQALPCHSMWLVGGIPVHG